MKTDKKLNFFTLFLLISFASVNAVLCTPALPDIATFFVISAEKTQQVITWFLIGYALGQLFYGPIANRFGRKTALYLGITLQIVSSILCVLAGIYHTYALLIIGRFLLAIGSGVGLKMTFTLVNECYGPKEASQKISYLLLAFAITPALSVTLGGALNHYYGWLSCFYGGIIYGLILLLLVRQLPETKTTFNKNALNISHLLTEYLSQFKNRKLIAGGFLMGCATSFVYIFASLTPFIAINLMGMDSFTYGIANLLPSMGLLIGSLLSSQLTKKLRLQAIIQFGILITSIGIILMIIAMLFLKLSALYVLFLPMVIIYLGLSCVIANASTVAMSYVNDKAHGSAIMNFINMGIATVTVITAGLFETKQLLLSSVYLILCIAMVIVFQFILNENETALSPAIEHRTKIR